MSPNAERRFLTGLMILAACVLILLFTRNEAKPDGFGGVPYPNHVEWTQYTVPGKGWMLCRPTVPSDSSKRELACLSLPPGTEVMVPRVVPGYSPEALRNFQNRSASR